MKIKKRLSPFSKEFWMKKGYSEEEADFKRNSIRPIRKEFWMKKGYSEEEAVRKAVETKISNSKKGAEKSSSRTKEEKRENSHRCKEFWMKKGYSEEEAVRNISNLQRTFSLDICVAKHGLEEGRKRWQQRQNKWQQTINSKTPAEIEIINKSKNSKNLKKYNNIDECIEQNFNMKLFKNIDDLIIHIKNIISQQPSLKYMPIQKFINKKIAKIQLHILNITEESLEEILKTMQIFSSDHKYMNSTTKIRAYRQWVGNSLLRSSFEIYFYEKFPFKEQLIIDKKYPNSNFRYDFYQ